MKRFAFLLTVFWVAASAAHALGETKGLGNVFGPSGETTLKASTDGAKYGLKCDGVTDTWAGLQAFLTAGARKQVKLDNQLECVVVGVSRTFVQSSTSIDGYGGAGIYFSSPSATYLTVSSTNNVTIKGLRIRGAGSGMSRTAWGALAAYNSSYVTFEDDKIEGVNGAGLLFQNTRDFIAKSNQISNTLSDIIHVTNGEGATPLTNCRNGKVTGNTGYKSGDDTFAVVSYLGTGNTPCENIDMLDNTSISSSQAGYSNIGSKNVAMTGLVKDAQGLNAVRIEEDLGYVTSKPENTRLDIMVENPSSTGVLVGRNAANTTGVVNISGTALRHCAFIGSNTSGNFARNTSLKVNGYGCAGPGVEINGAAGVDLTGTIEKVGQYGVVAPANTSDLDINMTITNIGQASPSTYNAVHLVNTVRGSVRGRCVDNQVTSTILGCVSLTNTLKVNSEMIGYISNTLTTITSVGTPSNTLMRDSVLRSTTGTYDPPSLASPGAASTTLTVIGAAVGDVVNVAFTTGLQGVTHTAEVTAADTVVNWFVNGTGTTRDLASGTIRNIVRKRP
jgi:hypothetical protein